MTEAIQFTEDQFARLIAKIDADRKAGGVGLGASPSTGLGLGDGSMGPLATGVWSMLAAGSPRLALAKAMGVPLAPYIINVRATFDDVDTADVPSQGADVKVSQDTLVDSLVVRTTLDRTAQGQFDNLNDYFGNFQNGIEATLDVQGAPRYTVAENFTPLSTLADVINGNARWPGGWILTYQQQLFMSFHSRITLPAAPVTVVCTFRTWVPTNDMFVLMPTRDAVARLAECGINLNSAYVDRVCR